MAGGVVGDAVRVVRPDVRDLELPYQELRKLEDPRRELLDPPPEPLIARQPRRHRVELAHHADAGARGSHDGLVGGEDLDEAPHQRYRLALVAGVKVHLAAAGLSQRKLDLVPEALKDLDGRPTRLRKERVIEARDKQRYAHDRPLFST